MDNQQDIRNVSESEAVNPQHNFPNYLSGLSHDIRTPLSAIIGFSDLLVEPRVSRAEQRNYCLMIARSSRKLLDLMSNLIDLAKMETENLQLFYKPVFIKELIEELKIEINEMANLYEKKQLVFKYNGPTDHSAKVFADKGRLFHVIRILMENSLRFTKEGGITLSVIPHEHSSYLIEIQDTGCGIDRETLENLFTMFPPSEVDLGKKMKVRGMSMAVVKKLCDRMDIDITVTSTLGTGTITRLHVPYKSY